MTDLLYYDDAYLRAFEATVLAVEPERDHGLAVTLDRTAFYPGGGGQPADTGALQVNGVRLVVNKVKRAGPHLVHSIAFDADAAHIAQALVPGAVLHGELDWPRRYRIMRTHTAMHILCGVVWRDYEASVTGGNMEPGEGRMDFEFATLSRELIGEIEAKCNAEVAAAHPVRSQLLPRDQAFQIPDLIRTKINLLPAGITEVRTVELEGLDLQADGGTHVHNTQEVGHIKITDYKSKGAINKRIYIKLAESSATASG